MTDVLELLRRHWGYESFLPNQQRAVEAVLDGRDCLAVLPTGGGKSLLYQLPALVLDGLCVVVSPLLALMKDQVDGLVGVGIEAAALNSALSAEERRDVVQRARTGRLKLLYVSPERMAMPDMHDLLDEARVSFFAVDEAHCVSQWGHEFRPEYRALGALREWFPGVPILACTATATPAVRGDVARVLGLRDPVEVIGDFDRPNLLYRAQFRRDMMSQVRQVLDRHRGEGGVIYCLRRADVDELTESLSAQGYSVRPYHAGLSADVRQANQEAFVEERVDVIVATVAFGMGIDRSNVRFVVHTAMPKSLENYQQEAGRAGRDRLEAECVLFYGASDAGAWRRIQGPARTQWDDAALEKIAEMYRYCRTLTCRHKVLVNYFGQAFDKEGGCGACDVCLGEHAVLEDSVTVARKILSAVARLKTGYGARYVAEVLKGSRTEKLLQNRHDQLSTYGLLSDYAIADITDWIDQLVGLDMLVREGEFNVLRLTQAGVDLMRDGGEIKLSMPRPAPKSGRRERTKGPAVPVDLSPEDAELFEALRNWRRDLARDRRVPPYLVLSDASLREIARTRPETASELRGVKGIGDTKMRDFGDALLAEVQRAAEASG